jgi:hypothetical protein
MGGLFALSLVNAIKGPQNDHDRMFRILKESSMWMAGKRQNFMSAISKDGEGSIGLFGDLKA